MMFIQDMVGTTYHAAKIIARSDLKRELITTIVPNAIGKLNPNHGKEFNRSLS